MGCTTADEGGGRPGRLRALPGLLRHLDGVAARRRSRGAPDEPRRELFLEGTALTETAPEDASDGDDDAKSPEEIADAEAKAEADAKDAPLPDGASNGPSNGEAKDAETEERDAKPAKKKKKKKGKDDAPPAMKIVGTEESEARTDPPPF